MSIAGTGFVDGADVSFSGTGLTVSAPTYVDANTLTVLVAVASAATSLWPWRAKGPRWW